MKGAADGGEGLVFSAIPLELINGSSKGVKVRRFGPRNVKTSVSIAMMVEMNPDF